ETTFIDPVANSSREQNAQKCTEWSSSALALLESGKQKEDRFQPFTRHRKKDHQDQSNPLVPWCLEGRINGMVQFRLDGTRSLTHPENHRRQNKNRNQTYDGLE